MTVQRYMRLAQEGGWIVIGQIVTVAGALVLVRVLTEYLEPEQYGQLTLGLTVSGLFNQVVMGGIGNGIGRFYSIAAEQRDFRGYFHATKSLLVYASLVLVLIGLILIAGLAWLGYSRWIGLASAALLLAVLNGYCSIIGAIQNAARQRAIVAIHGGLDAWLRILLAVGLVLWLGTSSTAVVIGYVCSSFLITSSQFFFLRRSIPEQHGEPAGHHPWLRRMWAYSLPFCTWGGFTWMQQVSDRWAMQAFESSAEVGQYAVLFQLGYTPIALVTGMATNFLGPILFQRAGAATDHVRVINMHHFGWRLTYIALVVTFLGFVVAFFMNEWLFHLLVAAEYRSSSYLLPWMVLAGGIFAAGQMLGVKLMGEMKSSAMTTAKIVTAILGVLFNVIGAALAGIQGVVTALVAFSAIYFFWMAVLGRRTLAPKAGV